MASLENQEFEVERALVDDPSPRRAGSRRGWVTGEVEFLFRDQMNHAVRPGKRGAGVVVDIGRKRGVG